MVVVAAPGQLLRAEAGGEAVRRVEVVGDQRDEAGPGRGDGVGVGVERQGLAGAAELQQLEVAGGRGRQAFEAAGGGDGGFEGELEVEGAGFGGRRARRPDL